MIESIRNISIGLGVMIILPLVTHVGVDVIFKDHPHVYRGSYKQDSKEYIEYTKKQEEFNEKHFYANVSVGIAAIVAGIIIEPPFLGMGLILGGVFCLSIGYLAHWSIISDIIKLLSLLAALVILILSGLRFSKGKKQK